MSSNGSTVHYYALADVECTTIQEHTFIDKNWIVTKISPYTTITVNRHFFLMYILYCFQEVNEVYSLM
jgi:hypothetical protein